MSEDTNARLREKTIQIVSLNQKIETLQAQLDAFQRRAIQFTDRIKALESEVAEKQSEIEMLRSDLSNSREALDSVGKEIQGIRAEQSSLLSKQRPVVQENGLRDELSEAQMKIEKLQGNLTRFSDVATSLINGDEGSINLLKKVLREVGDPRYVVLNMVLSNRSIELDEIASSLVINISEAMELVESLRAEGELEVRNGSKVIAGRKYRELEVPTTAWASLEPMNLFDRLGEFVRRTDDQDTIVRALETAVEILEQKLARGGALIFQMRKTADAWKKKPGDSEELQYTIREWATRAQALV